jgi:plastocyanin
MRRRQVSVLVPLFLTAGLALVACGGDTPSTATAPANSDLTVRARPSISWDAPSYSASSHGGKVVVTLINDSSTPHTLHIVESNDKDADPRAPKLVVTAKGDDKSGTFTLAPGTYRVVCSIPGHGNMKATLTVT